MLAEERCSEGVRAILECPVCLEVGFPIYFHAFSIVYCVMVLSSALSALKERTKSNYKGDVGVQDLPVQIWTQCLRAMLPESSPIELSSMQVINVHTKHSVT